MPDLGQSPFISFITPHFISLNRTKRSLLIFKTLICKPPTVFDAQFLFISMGFEFTNTLSSIGNLSPNLWPHFGPIWNLHCLQRDLDWDLYLILLHGSNYYMGQIHWQYLTQFPIVPQVHQIRSLNRWWITSPPHQSQHITGASRASICLLNMPIAAVKVWIMISIEAFFAFLY